MAATGYEQLVLLATVYNNSSVTPGATTTYSPNFPLAGFEAINVHYVNHTAATGTVPTMTLQLQQSDNALDFTSEGSATSTFHSAGDAGNLANTAIYGTYGRLVQVVNNADNVFPALTVNVFGVIPAPVE